MIKNIFASSGKFWNWLVVSSSDPSSVALTVKGVFSLAVVQGIFALLPLVGVHPTFSLTDLSDGVSNLVYTGLTTIAGAVSVYGIIRKAIVTMKPAPSQSSDETLPPPPPPPGM